GFDERRFGADGDRGARNPGWSSGSIRIPRWQSERHPCRRLNVERLRRGRERDGCGDARYTASSSSDHQLTATATTDASAHADLTSNVATNSPPAADASASNGTQAGTITQTASVSPAATGPNGSDTFVFAANFGHETIANFHPDTDLIQID